MEAITRLAGPTSIRPASLGATMETLQDTTPFPLGGVALLLGMAGDKAAGRLRLYQLRNHWVESLALYRMRKRASDDDQGTCSSISAEGGGCLAVVPGSW